MRISIVVPTIILISFLTVGCANKESIIPTPSQDMKAVYDQHMNKVGSEKNYDNRSLLKRPIVEEDVDLSLYVRTEKTQLQSRFRLIPNPIMYMFVAPHLASNDKVPVPGYLTEFKMWEQDNYALPGEVSDMNNHFEDK